uniref:Uncharacterized protein n=1 Tax=Anguilla anguilla TaxID=7936 RepID=A0A0E9UYX5_ANGAN
MMAYLPSQSSIGLYKTTTLTEAWTWGVQVRRKKQQWFCPGVDGTTPIC